jgi:hypothetical protein
MGAKLQIATKNGSLWRLQQAFLSLHVERFVCCGYFGVGRVHGSYARLAKRFFLYLDLPSLLYIVAAAKVVTSTVEYLLS